MNRKQRRIMKARIRKKEVVQTHYLGIDCVDPKKGFKIGDNIKIPGRKIVDGQLIENCKPGEETIFTLRYEGKQNRFKKFQDRKRKQKINNFFNSIKQLIKRFLTWQ